MARTRAPRRSISIRAGNRSAVSGLKYRFLKAKGLEYGEEQRDFIARLNKIAGRNAPVLDLNDDVGRVQ